MDKQKIDREADTAQRLLVTRQALQEKQLKVLPKFQHLANEVLTAPLKLNGLIDAKALSPEAISFARTTAIALRIMKDKDEAVPSSNKSMREIQYELFELFSRLFAALTGRAYELVSDDEEVRQRMMSRVRDTPDEFEKTTNGVSEELVEFYRQYATLIFQHARKFGGMRLVSGGQRTFGPSALNAVRITGLYADTQLIPDPIYPFLSAQLHLNAKPLQLAINLLNILQLRPLVNLELPVAPVFVFPSFEEVLEENDGHTKYGMEQLALRLISPYCNGTVESIEDLFEYVRIHGDDFSRSVLDAGLFIPPGEDPSQRFDVTTAINKYFDSQMGIRDSHMLEQMKALPNGVLILTGILERIRPQFHLLENANELGAQPLLSQPVHWHYFEKCATSNAEELLRREVLSDQAFQTLRAIQDDSLSWLANIPIEQLGQLIVNNEHKYLREELDGYTKQLASIDVNNANSMVREVTHGINSLIQCQQAAIKEIERKYEPAKKGAMFNTVTGSLLAGSVFFLPALSPLLGIALPAAGVVQAISRGVMAYGNAYIGESVEKKFSNQSMLGVLAVAQMKK